MINTKELAETYMVAARLLFMEDGGVEPIVAFHGGPTAILVQLMPHPHYHPSDQAVAITFAFATVFEATHVITVNEAWSKAFDMDTAPEDVHRGELQQRREAGDSSVHTSILVIAADLRRHENSLIATRDVDQTDEAAWTEQDLNLGCGSYLDRLLEAWRHGKEVGPSVPHQGDWTLVAETLGKMRVISSVSVVGSEDELAELIRRSKAGEN